MPNAVPGSPARVLAVVPSAADSAWREQASLMDHATATSFRRSSNRHGSRGRPQRWLASARGGSVSWENRSGWQNVRESFRVLA